MARVLELGYDQRRFLGWCLVQRRAHGHQGLHRTRVGIEGAAWKKFPKWELSDDPDTGLLIQDPPGMVLDIPEAYR